MTKLPESKGDCWLWMDKVVCGKSLVVNIITPVLFLTNTLPLVYIFQFGVGEENSELVRHGVQEFCTAIV